MAKYGKAASKRVKSAVSRTKKGTLKSGSGPQGDQPQAGDRDRPERGAERRRQGAGARKARGRARRKTARKTRPQDGAQDHRGRPRARRRRKSAGASQPSDGTKRVSAVLTVGRIRERMCARRSVHRARVLSTSPPGRRRCAWPHRRSAWRRPPRSPTRRRQSSPPRPRARRISRHAHDLAIAPAARRPPNFFEGPGGVFPYRVAEATAGDGIACAFSRPGVVARRQVRQVHVPDRPTAMTCASSTGTSRSGPATARPSRRSPRRG